MGWVGIKVPFLITWYDNFCPSFSLSLRIRQWLLWNWWIDRGQDVQVARQLLLVITEWQLLKLHLLLVLSAGYNFKLLKIETWKRYWLPYYMHFYFKHDEKLRLLTILIINSQSESYQVVPPHSRSAIRTNYAKSSDWLVCRNRWMKTQKLKQKRGKKFLEYSSRENRKQKDWKFCHIS